MKTDSRSKTVVVKSRTADPAKVCKRVQKKTKRRVELITPLPPPPEEEKKEEAPPPPPPEEKKEGPPKPITGILKVQMHCGSCVQLLQKRISNIEGVESVVTDLPNDQVIVKVVMEPAVLADSIQRKTRRPAVIIEDEKTEEEKKPEEGEKKPVEKKKADADGADGEVKKYEFWPPFQYYVEYVYPYAPPPPLRVSDKFGDENPNACAIV
uniref:HMA domain-containing protein n=1 Tax=Arundo donax TaxID=35708 RepID=A0A0A8XW32_ARUDO